MTISESLPSLSLLGVIPVPLLIANPAGQIVFTNRSLDELFGYRAGELDGSSIDVLVPPDQAEGHAELRTAYMQVPSPRTMGAGRSLHGVTRAGELIAVEIGLCSIEVAGETHVVASVVDVGSLRAEQEKTRLAIDASASGMIMVDETNHIVLVNTKAAEMFGYSEGELMGASIDVLVPDRYRRRHGVYRESYSSDPSSRAMGGDRKLHGLRADGTEFPVEIGLTPIDDHGRLMIMATVIDITERLAAEEEIERNNADLTRLNEELARFAYSASHDLKAPLATLEGILICVEQDLEDEELASAMENTDRARAHAGRMAQLIEGVLGMARAENIDDEIDDFDLCELVEQLRADVGSVFGKNDVELRNDIEPETILVSDRRRVSMILENLLVNGAKFADRGVDERYVRVGAYAEDGSMVLTVEDNGIGIPEDAHDHVFTMFRRFKNHDEPGTGLGLAMVRQHVERLSGTISFDSTSSGTAFTLRLPSSDRRRSPEPTTSTGVS